MEKFELTILGCGSALPTTRHFATSQVINIREKLYMIDCGEGAQLQMRRSRLKFSRLNHVFISHLHGDHCFGLIGLISTFGLLGRTAPLYVHAPAAFGPILQSLLDFFCKGLDFRVEFYPVDTSRHALIHEDRSVSIYSIPLRHRIECCGFLFQEKATLPHIRRDMIDFYRIPICEINNIKNGMDWTTEDGTLVPNHRLTEPSAPPRSLPIARTHVICLNLLSTSGKQICYFMKPHSCTKTWHEHKKHSIPQPGRQPHSHGTAKSKSSVSVTSLHGMKTKACS